ncbi:hypothetical protein GCM10010517_36680 [Streptosporangium fragile]|uniref:Uncharacterized protein n=1 Tax=Streptosporangium fragile TaxID=46186 RepID=A0ABN3W0Z8_9ACTN
MSPRIIQAIRRLPARDRARLTERLEQLRHLDRLMRQPGALTEAATK